MLFQGYEFNEAEIRDTYEKAKEVFINMGIELMSFDDWVAYNNQYVQEVKQPKRRKINNVKN